MATSAFVGASLHQLIAAARLPNTGISEIVMNASWRSFRAPSPGMSPSAPSPSKWPARIARLWRCLMAWRSRGDQCGFASSAAGNPLSEADERATLGRVVEAAQAIWR
jgi:hypothetical protein